MITRAAYWGKQPRRRSAEVHLAVSSLAFIGNASARGSRGEDVSFEPRRFR